MTSVPLTVFTPAYNRAHTIGRTYESLCRQTCKDFCWLIIDDGSTDNTRELVASWLGCNPAERMEGESAHGFHICYIWKENGGLHTGYNTAYANMTTELNVCIDSDDWMPDNAVELIIRHWRQYGGQQYAGIVGLDFEADEQPIGGYFPDDLKECYLLDLFTQNIHRGDSKQVMRTDLMRQVAPQEGFPGERNFNPVYMLLQVCDKKPLLVLNENLCYVEYQVADSMSRGIYNQYVNSPRSFAKLRLLEMRLSRNPLRHRFRSAVHYVSSCLLARESKWLSNAPNKFLVLCAAPLGVALYALIRYKTRK